MRPSLPTPSSGAWVSDAGCHTSFDRRRLRVIQAVSSLHLAPGSHVVELANRGDESTLGDQTCDCVVVISAAEYGRWDRLYLRRIFCALRPGGYLIASIPNRRYVPNEFDHLLQRIGFDVLRGSSHRFGPLRAGGLAVPHRLTDAIEWGLERASRTPTGAWLRDRGREYLAVAQKPTHAGLAARFDVTEALERGIETFEETYKSEFDRLADWENLYGQNWSGLSCDVVHRTLDRCRSAVVLSPHPDDELIGCGGVMLELLERGADVGIIQMTDGSSTQALREADKHTRRTIRSREARRVAAAMGVTHLTFLNARNGALDERPRYVQRLRNVLKNLRPEIVFLPFINDRNRDHVAANLILDDALVDLDDAYQPLVLAYEVWSCVPHHLVRTIDPFMPRKCDLLMMYPTPMRVVDYIWHCQLRDGHHSRRYLHLSGYAEAYLALERQTFADLVTAHRKITDPFFAPVPHV